MTIGPEVEILELTEDSMAESIYALGSYAFHPSPQFQDKESRIETIRGRKGVRYFAAVQAGQSLAGAAGTRMTQNIRGKIFPACGIWGVATLPQARRKGYCRSAMVSLLKALREDGCVYSNLHPFRESFYGRMGYINLNQPKIARFSPQSLSSLLYKDLPGEVELVLIGDGFEQFREYLFSLQPSIHGMAIFDYGEPQRAAQNRSWLLKALIDGKLAGLMLYDMRGEEITKFQLRAQRFYYNNSLARYLLLNWIARHIDQADRVELWLPSWEYPETWYEDMQVQTEPLFVCPMGRVLDLTRLDGLPVGNGTFKAKIIDPFCPWNEGTWQFSGRDGVLKVSSAQIADCELSIQALTALVYGVNDPDDFSIRGWGNPSSMVQQVMREMFPRQVVHLHEMF